MGIDMDLIIGNMDTLKIDAVFPYTSLNFCDSGQEVPMKKPKLNIRTIFLKNILRIIISLRSFHQLTEIHQVKNNFMKFQFKCYCVQTFTVI